MNVTLKRWIELDKLATEAKNALKALSRRLAETAIELRGKDDLPSIELLMGLHDKVEDAVMDIPNCHPQSEWLGGNSDDPHNHTLKEPHCVGYLQRHFSREEIAEAGMECLGPCQWRTKEEPVLWNRDGSKYVYAEKAWTTAENALADAMENAAFAGWFNSLKGYINRMTPASTENSSRGFVIYFNCSVSRPVAAAIDAGWKEDRMGSIRSRRTYKLNLKEGSPHFPVLVAAESNAIIVGIH